MLVSRDPCEWIVIGRDDGRFVDNAKHFFCWLHSHAPTGFTVTFLSENEHTVQQLREQNARSERYPSHEARKLLLRAGTVVVDNNHPFRRGAYYWFRGARIVQIWHGAPLKEIELMFHRTRYRRLGHLKSLLARIEVALTDCRSPDVLISPSTYFTHHAFDKSFKAKRTIETGYPRNDCLLEHNTQASRLLSINTDQDVARRMKDHRKHGEKVILYAPTFRDNLRSPFEDDGMDVAKWLDVACQDNLLIVMKLHPHMLGRTPTFQNNLVLQIEPNSDIYPLLSYVDLLITDYSSIYFDFLILDRPIVFFAYDLTRYISDGRKLIFDYDTMTPGPKAYTFDELLILIRTTLEYGEANKWKAERARVRNLTFDHVDGSASERIWQQLTNLGNQSKLQCNGNDVPE